MLALEPIFTVPQAVASIRAALCNLPDARKGGNNQRYTMGMPA